MTAVTKKFAIEQKATFRKLITYKDSTGTPIDLTDYAAHMQIRLNDGTLVADLSTDNNKIVLGGLAGTIELIIPATETKLMSFTTALYDLKLIAPNLDEIRLLQGQINLSVGQTE